MRGDSLEAQDSKVYNMKNLISSNISLISEMELVGVLKTNINDIFIINAYLTDTVKKGEVLWPSR
ncbi:MAG: hypothetical protein HW384_1502 [Dehalococcoidia bacterium]|nr:hypothetical protein [Dehalococcoidia bacterium]